MSSSRESNHGMDMGNGYRAGMLFLAAWNRLATPREPPPNDLLAHSRAALGHLGLVFISLIFILLSFWRA